MEPILRSAQVLKQEAEDIGFEGKEILEYIKEQQKLDRREQHGEKKGREQTRQKKREELMKSVSLRLRLRKNKPRLRLRKNKPRLRLRKNKPRLKLRKSSRSRRWNYKLNKLKLKLPPVPALQLLHPLVIKMPSPQSYHLL